MTNQAVRTIAGSHDEMESTVLLLIDSEHDRRLLADRLSESHKIKERGTTTIEAIDFDFCIVDVVSLCQYREELASVKDAERPTFLPFLLLTGERSPAEIRTGVWDLVDEILTMPVNRSELHARIRNLLQRRSLSLELTRRKEQNEKRFKTLFEATPDPVMVVTSDGIITELNAAFTRAFSVRREDVVGESVSDLRFTPSETVERLLLRIDDQHESQLSTGTVRWASGDDDVLLTELNTDVISGLGETAERIGIFRDITERAEQKEALELQNERLEEFAATIAHDLRNPLGVAKGHLELAQETGQDEYFEQVERAHGRMEQMIEEILTLAKEGKTVLDPTIISLNKTAERAWTNVETADATIEIELDGSEMIVADEGRLTELFENLFRNAVEHGGRETTVRIGVLDKRSGFYVADNGTGIPPDEREEVFEAGYSNSPDGTGFGLAIVQQIIDGHGWKQIVTEAEIGGARFEISGVE